MCQSAAPATPVSNKPVLEQLVEIGRTINNNKYRAVHLAAQYERSLQWITDGLSSAALGIARGLDMHTSTAREWIRVGQALDHLPLIDQAFATNRISYAKARILTRSANHDNEQDLVDLAADKNADRLANAVARHLDENDPDDDARDQRHHELRSFTEHTNADGMTVLRSVLPPAIGKPIAAAVRELVRRIAETPATTTLDTFITSSEAEVTGCGEDPPADAPSLQKVVDHTEPATQSGQNAPADAPCSDEQTNPPLPQTLRELRQRWQPNDQDDWIFPTLGQQQADAFAVLFLGLPIRLTTEVVMHIRGSGNTFDDGTPLTTNALARQLPHSFIRFMIHDAQRRPIDATNRRRYPTTRQKRVVSETHNHECVDCGTTDLIEFDHNPPYEQTGHTITAELDLRCTACHRARHLKAA